jgi:uncharacterized membrane protein YagU involved in acid resistance
MNQFQSLWASTAKELADGQGDEVQGQDENPTVKTARAISERVLHHNLTSEEEKRAAPVVHYALGTLLGTAYGTFAERAPVACAGYGAVYGSAVWLAADEFAVPAFGLSKPPRETPASSHVQALASHLVYGITTDLIRRAFVRDRGEHKSGRLSVYFS